MVSDCEYTRKYLCAYLGQEIDIGEGERIGLHLQRCPSCRAAYNQIQARQETLRYELRSWANGNRLPDGWSLNVWNELFTSLKRTSRHNHLNRYRRAFGWKKIRYAAMLIAVLFLLTLASPFFFWMASRLPYYGPWAERVVVPALYTRLDR